ncbi:MAG TPA: fibronectin type III domain-containing protein [Candidatus Limnocylindria bacterium]|nr:fibronectin type III domain-containing protein [Candidatus Limnocylindria bacterium]
MRRGARTAALVLVLAACGLKNDPLAPELVRPMPPASLSAIAAADGVTLRWRRPTSYVGGQRMRDLGGFDIERAPAAGEPFAKVGTLTLADQQRFRQERDLSWTDRSVVRGEEYVYRVVAFTTDGSRSVPSRVARIRWVPPAPATGAD